MLETRYTEILSISLAMMLTAAGTISCGKNDSPKESVLPMETKAASGEVIYKQYCANCHGENLEGQPNWKVRNEHGRLPAPPHDETGHTWHHADQLLFELTKFGMVPPNVPEGYESDMPAYKDTLTDEQIWAVLNYIKSRWPEETKKMQRETTSRSSSFKSLIDKS